MKTGPTGKRALAMPNRGFLRFCVFLVFFAFHFFHSVAIPEAEAAKEYWCKFKDDLYETKYDNDIADEISDEPGSYAGICTEKEDCPADGRLCFDYSDQGDSTQAADEMVLCHYDSSSDTWNQIYELYTGYFKGFWCEFKDGDYETKLEKTTKIQGKIDDNPGSERGLCSGDTTTKVYCEYKNSEYSTKDKTAAEIVTGLTSKPGSHRGGCTESHEFHMKDHQDQGGPYSYAGPYDYWGHCTNKDYSRNATTGLPESPWVAPGLTDSAGDKKLGVGIGGGQKTRKRAFKPRRSRK